MVRRRMMLVVVSATGLALAQDAGRPVRDGGVRDGGVRDGAVAGPAVMEPTLDELPVVLAELDAARARLEVERVKRLAAEDDATAARNDRDRLRAELAEVKSRLKVYEARFDESSGGLAGTLSDMRRQLEEIRATVTAERTTRLDREDAQSRRQAGADAAVAALSGAQATLASGSVSGVDAALRVAEQAFSGPARQYVDAARRALQNSDLASARTFLGYAIAEASAGRY